MPLEVERLRELLEISAEGYHLEVVDLNDWEILHTGAFETSGLYHPKAYKGEHALEYVRLVAPVLVAKPSVANLLKSLTISWFKACRVRFVCSDIA